MSRYFPNTGNNSISFGSTSILDDLPAVSAAVWVYKTAKRSNDEDYFRKDGHFTPLQLKGTASNDYGSNLWTTSSFKNRSYGALTADVWHLCVSTYDGSTLRLYKDGTETATGAITGNLPGGNSAPLIFGQNGSDSELINGRIALPTLWSAALTVDEIAAMVRGVDPRRIRPGSIIFHAPFDGLQSPEPDYGPSRLSGTVTGATRDNGPPVTLFTPKWHGVQVAAGGGGAVEIGQATEIDTAQPLTHGKVESAGQAIEADTAQSVTAHKALSIGQPVEADTAQAVTHAKRVAVSQTTEADTAQPVTTSGSKTIVIGQPTETSVAFEIASAKNAAIGQAVESDMAIGASRVRLMAVNQVIESDSAIAISHDKARAIGQVSEIDIALALVTGASPVNARLLATLNIVPALAGRASLSAAVAATLNIEAALAGRAKINP